MRIKYYISKFGNLLKPEIDTKAKLTEELNLNEQISDEVEIRKSFIIQFAENQNHQQKLFIQFLSSVLFVIIAFGFVYTNTATKTGIKIYGTADPIKIILNDTLNKKTDSGKTLAPQSLSDIKKGEQFDSLIVFADPRSAKKNLDGSIFLFL